MAKPLQQAGTFRGRIVAYSLNEAESGATSIFLTVAIDEVFSEGEWYDWASYGFEVSGDMWVIKKDRSINERQVRALMDCAGWDGSIIDVTERRWEPRPVQIQVEEDSYKDELRYRIAFINAFDRTPGGGNVSAEKAQALHQQYGSQLRALATNAVRNAAPPPADSGPVKPAPAAKPASRPAARKKAPAAPAPDAYSEPDNGGPAPEANAGDVPF